MWSVNIYLHTRYKELLKFLAMSILAHYFLPSAIYFCHYLIYLFRFSKEQLYAWIDSEPQLEEDELLARALQESLNIESPPESESRNESGTGNGYGNGYGHSGFGHGYGKGFGHGNGYGHGNDSLYQPTSFPYATSLR